MLFACPLCLPPASTKPGEFRGSSACTVPSCFHLSVIARLSHLAEDGRKALAHRRAWHAVHLRAARAAVRCTARRPRPGPGGRPCIFGPRGPRSTSAGLPCIFGPHGRPSDARRGSVPSSLLACLASSGRTGGLPVQRKPRRAWSRSPWHFRAARAALRCHSWSLIGATTRGSASLAAAASGWGPSRPRVPGGSS